MLVKGQMKVCYPKLYNLAHAHLHPLNVLPSASKRSNNCIFFGITATGVVPCGDPKSHPVFHLYSADYIFL